MGDGGRLSHAELGMAPGGEESPRNTASSRPAHGKGRERLGQRNRMLATDFLGPLSYSCSNNHSNNYRWNGRVTFLGSFVLVGIHVCRVFLFPFRHYPGHKS